MSERASSTATRPGDFRHWKPEAQARALELLEQREATPWRPFYCQNTGCNGHPHAVPTEARPCDALGGHPWTQDEDEHRLPGVWHCRACGVLGTLVDEWAWEHARADQHPPKWTDSWLTWLMAGGRGSGKTRGGAEITHRVTDISPRIILIAPTGPDLRETMVEGVSGILACSPPGKMPTWEPSKKKLTWPNGAIAQGFSAEEPDRLRGPQSGFIWADEPAYYPDTEKVWDNMQFGLRVKNKRGFSPKIVGTTTPKPIPWMRKLIKDDKTRVHTVSTYANLANLADTFRDTILEKYEGTRTGEQELHGKMLEDVQGALWAWEMFQYESHPPLQLKRIVVGVDPAGTANKRSDETGIVVVGIDFDNVLWVLADYSGKYSPAGWAAKVVTAFEMWSADAIVAEKNYGGDMVRFTLESTAEGKGVLVNVKDVDSRRGKAIRAEPVVALYERKKVKHVTGADKTGLAKLQEEQTTWEPMETSDSPNRIDALVHAATDLAKRAMPAQWSDPANLTMVQAGMAGTPALAGAGFVVPASTASYAVPGAARLPTAFG